MSRWEKKADGLTAQQLAVLEHLSRGRSNADTAAMMELSVKTVEAHRGRMHAALGAENSCHAVRLGFERGLLRADEMKRIESIRFPKCPKCYDTGEIGETVYEGGADYSHCDCPAGKKLGSAK